MLWGILTHCLLVAKTLAWDSLRSFPYLTGLVLLSFCLSFWRPGQFTRKAYFSHNPPLQSSWAWDVTPETAGYAKTPVRQGSHTPGQTCAGCALVDAHTHIDTCMQMCSSSLCKCVVFSFRPQYYLKVGLRAKKYICNRRYAPDAIQRCNFVHARCWLHCATVIIEAQGGNRTPRLLSAHTRTWLCPEAVGNWLTETFSRWKASGCLSHLVTAAGMRSEDTGGWRRRRSDKLQHTRLGSYNAAWNCRMKEFLCTWHKLLIMKSRY